VRGASCRVPGVACVVPRAGCLVPGACGTVIALRRCMVAQRYDELEAWQLANELKQKVYELIGRSSAKDDRRFCDQIRDSAVSAPSNLAEGFGYSRHPEFARHTRTAKSSLMETQNHLVDGVDRGHWPAERARPLVKLADRAIGKCVRLLQYLETSDAPGTTVKPPRKGTTFPERERQTHRKGTTEPK
jgi:four helix bundle protein